MSVNCLVSVWKVRWARVVGEVNGEFLGCIWWHGVGVEKVHVWVLEWVQVWVRLEGFLGLRYDGGIS